MRKPILPFQPYTAPGALIPKIPEKIQSGPKDLPRIVHYPADQSGCSAWRMEWPGHLLVYHNKAQVQSSTVMVTNPEWYTDVKIVKVQRQASEPQRRFMEFLKSIQPKYGFRLIYEIDDIVFREDIPEYNKFGASFESDEIRNNSTAIMQMCDEITTTGKFIADYYKNKLGKEEITIIPNFPPKWWIGNYYNAPRIKNLYDKHRKKPRILYCGSAAHYDIDNKAKGRDDFAHILKAVIDSRHKYQWVFIGGYPPLLAPYIKSGEIEFHGWQRTYDYGQKIQDLEVNMMIAPLVNNTFNKAKSDIKFIEACAFGVPIACQDLCTYENAPLRFTTGEEMLNVIDKTLRNRTKYKEDITKWRAIAEERFLENDDNIDCFLELALYPYGDERRVNIKKWNNL